MFETGYRLALLLGLLCGTTASPSEARTFPSHAAAKVVNCFEADSQRNKVSTIEQMRNCSGYWVTPKALLECAVGTFCPVYSDTIEGRTAFFATLQEQKLNVNSPLRIDKANLAPLPTAQVIERCRKTSLTQESFIQCVGPTIPSAKYSELRTCFTKSSEKDRLACMLALAKDQKLKALVDCIQERGRTTSAIVNCYPDPQLKPRIELAQKCVGAAPTAQAALACLSNGLIKEQKQYAECVGNAKNPRDNATCLSQISPQMAKAQTVVECVSRSNGSALLCMSGSAPGPFANVQQCLSGANSLASRSDCIQAANPEFLRAQRLAECATRPNDFEKCASQYVGGDAGRLAKCVASKNNKLDECLTGPIAQAYRSVNCISPTKGTTETFKCLAPQIGGDAPRIATCLEKQDRTAMGLCLLGDSKEAHAAQEVYQCVSAGKDGASLIENCTNRILDDKSRKTLACVARSTDDKASLAACAASAVMPPEVARIASCAATSSGMTSFALCTAAPSMNEEWRIAAECAVQTGGVPYAFAVCVAGQLTIRELTKCFTGQIGKDCFGPNNTIVEAIRNAYKDVTEGPGKNNEVVKAINAIGEATGGPNSVVRNPGQLTGGSNSMINNPSQIWGGSNSVFNNPSQVFGGPNSVINNPGQMLPGPNSVLNPGSWFK